MDDDNFVEKLTDDIKRVQIRQDRFRALTLAVELHKIDENPEVDTVVNTAEAFMEYVDEGVYEIVFEAAPELDARLNPEEKTEEADYNNDDGKVVSLKNKIKGKNDDSDN